MNVLRVVWQRVFMFLFYKATYLMNWRIPELIEGNDSVKLIPNKIKELGMDNCFLVIDPGLIKLGLDKGLIDAFKESNLKYTTFSKIEPNPKICDIEEGVKEYIKSGSSCIVTLGGGSAMDTAKAIGARIARPKKSIEQLGGLLKVGKKIPPLFAIPTTAGTGSETTIASVVTNEITHHKYAINDLHLIPLYAVLDPMLTVGLPKSITSSTGMDALTHAVEGYLSCDVPKKYRILAEEAVEAIIKNIEVVYNDGSNIEARREMLYASFKAGAVFTRVGLTYVHPIAHTFGGLYSVPHGLANAITLPYCLKKYGKKVYKKLSRLSDIAHLSSDGMSEEEKAKAFIEKIEKLNKQMELNKTFDERYKPLIKDEDIPQMIKWAQKEANAAYYPPVILSNKDLEEIIKEIKS